MSTLRSADDGAVAEAAARLARGGLVAFPTETVYGLGASTFDAAAVAQVYAMKGRPQDNPLIAHVPAGDAGAIGRLAADWPDAARRLAEAFWPGPLTVVVPRHAGVPAVGTGGRDTIAIRCPSHPVAQALLAAFGGPVSAPSANRSGHVSPTTAGHVMDEFPNVELLVLDGGPCAVGIESSVVALRDGEAPRLLRPGSITAAAMSEVLGEPVRTDVVPAQDASPGTRSRHYAPRGPVSVVAASEWPSMAASAASADRDSLVVLTFDAADVPPPHRAIEMPSDPGSYAAALYAAVRRADVLVAADGAARIVIVAPPAGDPAWDAVHDRLGRMVAAE